MNENQSLLQKLQHSCYFPKANDSYHILRSLGAHHQVVTRSRCLPSLPASTGQDCHFLLSFPRPADVQNPANPRCLPVLTLPRRKMTQSQHWHRTSSGEACQGATSDPSLTHWLLSLFSRQESPRCLSDPSWKQYRSLRLREYPRPCGPRNKRPIETQRQ